MWFDFVGEYPAYDFGLMIWRVNAAIETYMRVMY